MEKEFEWELGVEGEKRELSHGGVVDDRDVPPFPTLSAAIGQRDGKIGEDDGEEEKRRKVEGEEGARRGREGVQ